MRLRRLENAVATSDLDGFGLGAELGAADPRVKIGAVSVEEGVLFRSADSHFGDSVGDVLFAVAGFGRGNGVGRGCAAGEALEDRVGICTAGLFERGWCRGGCGDQRYARRYRGVSTSENQPAGGMKLTAPSSIPMPRNHDPHGRAAR